jgi:hypothetical protein
MTAWVCNAMGPVCKGDVCCGLRPETEVWALFSSLKFLLSSLYHIKYTKRHMFGLLNVDEIKN